MDKIAVIGVSSLFPEAKTPEQFFKNLLEEKDSTSVATAKEMGVSPELHLGSAKGETDKYYNLHGGYIRDFQFDPKGYDLPAEDLKGLDDIYKWALYVSREALKDGGYLDQKEKLARCGVLLGNLSFPTKSSNKFYIPLYDQAIESVLRDVTRNSNFTLPGSKVSKDEPKDNHRISGYPATLIAKALSLSATHFALDAACASSLYSVKLACDYLLAGKADLMLAGAVSGADPFFVTMGFSTFQAYPENDLSRPLDRNSAGLVAGEGAGMFLLKRYEDALHDGDKIYGTILGVGLSNDGKGKSVLSPNPKGQILSYERAYKDAGITPSEIQYIECHATGTPLGDVTELESLDQFFTPHESMPYLGTVKASFGHLLTAAGMPSMLKILMSMGQETIPATIKIKEPLSPLKDEKSMDRIVRSKIPWPQAKGPKRAAVNAFGFGGTNAHLIFEEPPWPLL